MKEKIAQLKTALEQADNLAVELLKDDHMKKCPYVAPVRSGIHNGALARMEHVEAWLENNPVPEATPAAPATPTAPAAPATPAAPAAPAPAPAAPAKPAKSAPAKAE